MRALAILLFVLTVGCSTLKGDTFDLRTPPGGTASIKTCEVLDADGTCHGAVIREVRGPKGNENFYSALVEVAGFIMSGVGVVIAALR